MRAWTASSAAQQLSAVQRLAQLEAFDEARFADTARDEVAGADDPEAADRAIDALLSAIDAFAVRAMRIQLDHLLAADHSVAAQFRTYLATQVTDYIDDLETLRERVAGVAARVDPDGAAATADGVVAAAGEVLALRARLRAALDRARPRAEPPPEPDDQPEPDFFSLLELD